MLVSVSSVVFFFFNDPATPEISPLPLPDALPIWGGAAGGGGDGIGPRRDGRLRHPRRALPRLARAGARRPRAGARRSEEHTSELQSRQYLVCRLLLEKKK